MSLKKAILAGTLALANCAPESTQKPPTPQPPKAVELTATSEGVHDRVSEVSEVPIRKINLTPPRQLNEKGRAEWLRMIGEFERKILLEQQRYADSKTDAIAVRDRILAEAVDCIYEGCADSKKMEANVRYRLSIESARDRHYNRLDGIRTEAELTEEDLLKNPEFLK